MTGWRRAARRSGSASSSPWPAGCRRRSTPPMAGALRQAGAAAKALEQRGVSVIEPATGPTSILVTPGGLGPGQVPEIPGATVLTVFPDDASREDEGEQLVGRIPVDLAQRGE